MEHNNRPKAEICDRLKEALALRGMKAADLVEKTGIPKNTMSYYLSGKTEPKADRLYIISSALDINEAWLLGYDVPIHRSPTQKKNDQLVELIALLRTDPAFFTIVQKLSKVSPEDREVIDRILAGLLNK